MVKAELLQAGIKAIGERNSAFEARELLCAALGITKEEYYASSRTQADPDAENKYLSMLQRRIKGEPLAYILGEWDFYGRSFFIESGILIPRPETELLIEIIKEAARELKKDGLRLLDLCSGSGCIGITAALEIKGLTAYLGDIEPKALAVSARNAERYKEAKTAAVYDDALGKGSGKYDIIVSNPPYISEKEMEELPAEVKDFEPVSALAGGRDGLDFYRAITANRLENLTPGGYMIFETGESQGNSVAKIMRDSGMADIKISRDLSGKERAVSAKKADNV